MQILTVNQLKCKRCGHVWVNRKVEVRICPRCKSAYWDKDRINKKKEEK